MKNILIIEDEESLGELYLRRMKMSGFSVKWAKTINEALDISKKFIADCVLIDHGMDSGDKSGSELIPFYRKNFPRTKIIMLSNFNASYLKDASSYKADEYLTKIDYSPKKLIDYLRSLGS